MAQLIVMSSNIKYSMIQGLFIELKIVYPVIAGIAIIIVN